MYTLKSGYLSGIKKKTGRGKEGMDPLIIMESALKEKRVSEG